MELAVVLDKLSKIGPDKVLAELKEKGFSRDQLSQLEALTPVAMEHGMN